MNSTIKYPNIFVDLSTVDGNAFAVMGAVTREMRKHKIPASEIDAYRKEATSGNYDHLLATTMAWVSVDFICDSDSDYMTDEEHDDLMNDYDNAEWD